MKKSIIYSLIIIVIIILGIVVGVNLTKDDEIVPTNSNKTENNVTENKVENKVENVIENKVEDNTNVENIVEKPIASGEKDASGNPKTDLERAIEIVKKDWGEDNTVYFAQDGQTANGEYIICVRDNNTTSALAWYTVDIADESFEKE